MSVARISLDPTRPGPVYGRFTRFVHWATAAALLVQFTIGYSLDVGGGRGRGRGRGRGGESGRGRGRGRGGEDLEIFGDDALLTAHVVLGVTILVLTLVRVYWRRRTTLPPWAEGLSAAERVLAHWTERVLYVVLFAIPLTGLSLVFVSDEMVGLHVASHIAFFLAFAAHVGLVLKHQVINRDRLLRRMI